jgi:autotransporter-associated beta strand protein
VVQNGAALELSGGISVGNLETLLLTGSGVSSGGALRNVSGANSYAGAVTVGIGGARINNDVASTLTLTGGLATNGAGDVTFGGVGNTTVSTVGINGAGGLTKDGTGTLTLSATNSYIGATTVSDGKLFINGNQSTATGVVSVAAAATLGGNGTVGGATTFTGASIHAPGSAAATVGTQAFSSTVTYGTGTIFDWDLNTVVGGDLTDPGVVANAATGIYDQVTATGAITATGSNAVFKIVLAAGDSFADAFWNTHKSWNNIFTGGSGSATNLAAIFSSFDASGGLDATGLVAGRGQFTLSSSSNTLTWTAVPEPTTALAGLLLTAGLLRRRRKGNCSGAP